MRSIFFIVFILFCSISYSQNQQPESKAEKEKAETEDVELDELKEAPAPAESTIESKKAKSGKVKDVDTRRNAFGYEMEVANDAEEGSKQDAQYQTATMRFESSQTNSSLQRTQRTPSVVQQSQMDDAVGYFEANSPNSFEYHYYKYTAGNYDVSLYAHLKEAERLKPNNSDVHVQLAAYHIIKENKSSASAYMKKLIEAKRLNPNTLQYAGDVLRSTPQNGTLITHGFIDSYGTWYMQSVKGVRPDVQLVSLDFLQSEEYRSKLKKKGYVLPTSTKINVSYFGDFCRKNNSKKLAVSMTTPKEYLKPILPNAYVTGLVFEYRTEVYSNFQRNEDLWHEGLNKGVVQDAPDEKTRQLSANYLPMLLQMRKVYNQRGDRRKVADLDRAIDKIGAQCKKYDKVQKLKSAY